MKIDWILCFLQIIYKEIIVFSKVFKSKIVDIVIIISTSMFVFGYVMPKIGLPDHYGPIILSGIVPLICFFEIITRTVIFVSDITENKKISYLITLPIPSWMTVIAIPIGWAACTSMITIFVVPIGILFLLKEITFFHISIVKFLLIFISINLFFSFFALFLSGLIKDTKYVSWIWSRVVNPMFMLGAYFYTWSSLYKTSHLLGIINLFNPIIYTMEGIRGTLLKNGFISFYICFFVLWVLIFIFGFFAVKMIKNRLDCV